MMALLGAISMLFVYSIGARADIENYIWARCTDSKNIKPCKLTVNGIVINNKLLDVEILDIVEINGTLNVLYTSRKP